MVKNLNNFHIFHCKLQDLIVRTRIEGRILEFYGFCFKSCLFQRLRYATNYIENVTVFSNQFAFRLHKYSPFHCSHLTHLILLIRISLNSFWSYCMRLPKNQRTLLYMDGLIGSFHKVFIGTQLKRRL